MTRPVPIVALAAALVAACSPGSTPSPPTCPAGQERCGFLCVDPATYADDAGNCGACGIACGLGTCVAGACRCAGPTSCPTSIPRCPDTQNDRHNCGSCGNVCQRPNEACASGTCQCVAPFTDCGASCANLETDAANCSQCGVACPLVGDVCVGGQCQCPTGDIACPPVNPTQCVNPASDTSNCGACGTACAAGAVCDAGQCACPAGETVCNGACVNLQTDAANCRACGAACATGASCAAGLCNCPPAERIVCGIGPAPGTCCAGNGCCTPRSGGPSTCMTQHSNGIGVSGLGQSFYDCLPLGTYDAAQAQKAAQAWDPAGQLVPGLMLGCVSQSCIGWQTAHACGTWCYGGSADPLRGRATLVQSIVCQCPTAGTPNWN